MTVSLTLFISASLFVRLFSVPFAVAMCAVAAVIPPIAAITANKREADDYWWDEQPPDGSAESQANPDTSATGQKPGGNAPEDDGGPDAPPRSHRSSDPADDPERPTLEHPTEDELLWEQELRGYNGERFGRDS